MRCAIQIDVLPLILPLRTWQGLDVQARGQGRGLENWSSRILEDKDFPRGQQHWSWLPYTATYTETLTSSGVQFKVVYWLTMTLGDAAQLAAAHCLNERTLDPTVCSYNRPSHALASRTMAFTPQCTPATTHYLSSKYYQILIATHSPTPEGWKAELASVNNLLKVITRRRQWSWWDSNLRPLSPRPYTTPPSHSK